MNRFEINKILVPYDFSSGAMNALDTALVIAQQQTASIVLLHVIEKDRTWFSGSKGDFVSAVQDMTRLANENLNMLVKTLSPKYFFPIECAVHVGIPVFEICQYAWERDCDIVVMGKAGRSVVGSFFSESVHGKVIKNCSCPVLLVPQGRLFTRFKKIVFPVRVAPSMVEKYDIVKPFVQENDSSMIVAGLTGVNNVDDFRHVSQMVDTITDRLRIEGVPFTSGVTFCSSSISGQLLEISNGENADMIVITSVVGGYFKSFFLEYYTRMVIEKANCPVLSIRPDTIQSSQN